MSKRKKKRNRFRNRQKERKRKLNERRQAEFQALVAGIAPDRILYLPLDIGKNVHWFRADTGAGRSVHAPKPLPTDRQGYACWSRQVQGWLTGGQFDLLVAGHEPTGIYHENWCRHILSDFAAYLPADASPLLLYRLLNPYQVKLERQMLTLRPRKSDPIDLRAISGLLRQGQGNPASLPDPQIALLRQHVFSARQSTRKLKATRIEIIRSFDRIWPGAIVNVKRFQRAHPDLPTPRPIVRSKPLERDTFRVLLEHCPDPYRVRELDCQGIINLFHQHGARCGPVTAQRILVNASNALLSPPAVLDVYLQGLQLQLADEAHWLTRQQEAESQLESLAHHTPARHLLSIRGISPRWAACYLDLVGSPPRFDWADQVWAFVGFDPIYMQSGDSNPDRPMVISRRGDPFHRNLLTWSATLVAGHHPLFGQVFIEAEARGLGIWGAAIHTAHKLQRTCFRLLLDDRPFRDDTPPEDFARWRTYWLAWRKHRRQPEQHPHPGHWRPTA